MRISPTELPEVLLVEPTVHRDERGFFLESWHAEKFAAAGLDVHFVQDNQSGSRRGTLRGLHAQVARPQGKLVRASLGEIYDVAVDIRPGSPRFGSSVGLLLSAENFRQLWVPDKPVFSVQHHPEASPGPQDSHYLFTRFTNMMRERKGQSAQRER